MKYLISQFYNYKSGYANDLHFNVTYQSQYIAENTYVVYSIFSSFYQDTVAHISFRYQSALTSSFISSHWPSKSLFVVLSYQQRASVTLLGTFLYMCFPFRIYVLIKPFFSREVFFLLFLICTHFLQTRSYAVASSSPFLAIIWEHLQRIAAGILKRALHCKASSMESRGC